MPEKGSLAQLLWKDSSLSHPLGPQIQGSLEGPSLGLGSRARIGGASCPFKTSSYSREVSSRNASKGEADTDQQPSGTPLSPGSQPEPELLQNF